VAETFAGKGSFGYNEPQEFRAAGVNRTPGAIEIAKEADLVIGVRLQIFLNSDFTTISKSPFQESQGPVYQY